ncbi:MAG: M28 family peptidase [Planctomycetota bacterium]
MSGVFDPDEAMKVLSAIDPYYRVRGNHGYQKSLERVMILLRAAGFSTAGVESGARDTAEYRDYGPVQPAWTPLHARLALVTEPEETVLHAFEDESGDERTFLCVNSFPTRPEGIVAPLARYDASKPAEVFAGTVVYGSQPSEVLYARAVQQGGALGVISSYLPDYNAPETNPDSIRYSKVPYDAERHGFGLNVSRNVAQQIEKQLASGVTYVKVTIGTRFEETRGRTVVASIGGTLPSAGTVALVGHLDEPGANDNGTGIAAMAAMAAGYVRAIRAGTLPRPRRSITFIFGNEFECSREWLSTRLGAVDMALVIDMVGENQELTGATALVERMPDPGAIWDRLPLDEHTQWGRSDALRESDLAGSFLNDYVMEAMRIRAEQTGWRVRSNPFEGGSDHESFLERGVPAVLLWHFTDQYYHTSLDRLDKVDPAEMQHVAIAALGLLHHFGNAGLQRADEVLDIVMRAARTRLATEAANARRLLSAPAVAADPDQISLVSRRERAIIVAWSRWYREALLSLEGFEPDPGADPGRHDLTHRIDEALVELRDLEQSILESI